LKVLVENNEVTFHSIKGEDVEGIILNFIDLHKINLIAMHVHHRNFFDKLFEISLSKISISYQCTNFGDS
jgi:hypothetical protein